MRCRVLSLVLVVSVFSVCCVCARLVLVVWFRKDDSRFFARKGEGSSTQAEQIGRVVHGWTVMHAQCGLSALVNQKSHPWSALPGACRSRVSHGSSRSVSRASMSHGLHCALVVHAGAGWRCREHVHGSVRAAVLVVAPLALHRPRRTADEETQGVPPHG